jgi:hypothetical protein
MKTYTCGADMKTYTCEADMKTYTCGASILRPEVYIELDQRPTYNKYDKKAIISL